MITTTITINKETFMPEGDPQLRITAARKGPVKKGSKGTKKKAKAKEKTSIPIATVAGRLLNGRGLVEAERWLRNLTLYDTSATDEDRTNALTILGAIEGMRRLAGSALTQREK